MAQQTINVGNAPDDGLGDTLRDAFIKVNANFTELYTSGGGGGGGGVTDHGALTGLGDDDHPQYHNDARGDVRYLSKSSNLSDLSSVSSARDNLGVGSSQDVTFGTLTSSGYTSAGNIMPDADASRDIGSLSLRFSEVYSENFYMGNGQVVATQQWVGSQNFDNYGSFLLRTTQEAPGEGESIENEASGDFLEFSQGTNTTVSRVGNRIQYNAVDNNYYLSSLSWDDETGILTATVNGASNQTVDLDGRYSLDTHGHSEFYDYWELFADNDGVSGGQINSTGIVNIFGSGNISTSRTGSTVTISSSLTDTNFYLTSLDWDDTTGILTANMSGQSSRTVDLDGRYSLQGHTHSYDNYQFWELFADNDGVDGAEVGATESVNFIGGTGIDTSRTGNNITISSSITDTNFYLSSFSWDDTTGILTANMSGASDRTIDLDGRYSLLGHTHSYDNYQYWELRDGDDSSGAQIGPTNLVVVSGGTGITVTRTSNNLSISSTITDTNFYLSSFSWDDTTGVLTANMSGASARTIDLDGRYSLQGHTHSYDNYQYWILLDDDDVSGAQIGPTEQVGIFGGSNVTTSRVGNNITISASTGTDTNYYLSGLSFDTGTGILTATVTGASNQTVDLDGRYSLSGHGHSEFYDYWELFADSDGVSGGQINSTGGVTFAGGTNVTTSRVGSTITIDASIGTDTNYYLSGLSFDTATGILTATVTGTSNQTVDLDNRYSLTSHSHSHFSATNNPHSVTASQVGAVPSGGGTFTGNVTVNGTFTLSHSTWHKSSDGKNRFHFGSNSHTYIRTASNVIFRNDSNSTTATISSTGNLTLTGTSFATNHEESASDIRLKSNLRKLDPLKIASYATVYLYDKETRTTPEISLIAQDMEAANPHLVGNMYYEKYESILTLSPLSIASVALAGVKEVNYKTDRQTNLISQLRARVVELEREVERLKVA